MKKFLMCFVFAGMAMLTSCEAKKAETGTNTDAEPVEIPDGPTATDRAETTTATTDSAGAVLIDSAETEQ